MTVALRQNFTPQTFTWKQTHPPNFLPHLSLKTRLIQEILRMILISSQPPPLPPVSSGRPGSLHLRHLTLHFHFTHLQNQLLVMTLSRTTRDQRLVNLI
jgi:hypothetical protein